MREPTVPVLMPGMDLPRHKHRLPRPALVIIAIFAGMFFAFALSTLLAGPANAAPETGLSSPILGQAGSVVPASTLAQHFSPVVRSTSKSILITSVTSPTRLATPIVATVVHNVSPVVGPLVSQVATTVNRSIPAVSPAHLLPGAAPRARTSSLAIDNSHRVDSAWQQSPRLEAVTKSVVANPIEGGGDSLRFDLNALGSPPALPLRSPVLPTRNLPVIPVIPAEGLPSGHGNSRFASILSRSLLLPASLEGVAPPGLEKVPYLLLDMRQSPPG